MLHHKNTPNFNFVVVPKEFNKYTDKKLLQYCLGATMYMPGTKNFLKQIIEKSLPELTSIVWCFEDACPENMVETAENNVLAMLDGLNEAVANNVIKKNDIPLLFCRIRNLEQFKRFTSKLTKEQMELLTGINFPKFNSENGEQYFSYLADLNKKNNELLYGMPIIEDSKVAFKETRIQELLEIRKILDKYYGLVLQVRVGGTDFSSCFGVRRGIDYSIYDILTVKECLSDILNIFSRNNAQENSEHAEKIKFYAGFNYVRIDRDNNGNYFNPEHLLKYAESCHYIVRVMRTHDGETVLYNYDVPNRDLFKFMKSFDENTLDGTIIEIDKYFPDDLA